MRVNEKSWVHRPSGNSSEHFLSGQIKAFMDLRECDSLCARLRESVSLGPGPHNAPFALPEVLGIISMLRAAALGDEVMLRLAVIEREFKSWFSVDGWRGLDRGVSFQRDLYANIWCLKLGVHVRLSPRSGTEVHRAGSRRM
jgi:hypothetical protein